MQLNDLRSYLDSTFLNTESQLGISDTEYLNQIDAFVQEAIDEKFKLVMIRPNMVSFAKDKIQQSNSKVLVGTVIDFPEGTASTHIKLEEATIALQNGADEIDFVSDYNAFKHGAIEDFKDQIFQCTKLVLDQHKTVKWIIEVAALTESEIIKITSLIKQVVIKNFKEDQFPLVYVKSSTGFFKTQNNLPNGATISAIVSMLENAFPLPVKASGGVRSFEDASQMIALGIKRIGTSSAKRIISGQVSENNY